MKSHYSQTVGVVNAVGSVVLLPYEITLFSNPLVNNSGFNGVLLPYEITLFSNVMSADKITL